MEPPPERFWRARLRWRMRGAWLWPAFGIGTLVDAILLGALPLAGETGPDGIVPALILAGALNLAAVAALAPLAGRLLRRVRGDLPRVVAVDRAGTALVCVLAAVVLTIGLVHRGERERRLADRHAAAAAAREYLRTVEALDVLRYDDDLYRVCAPHRDRPDRARCVLVSTGSREPRVMPDDDARPNSAQGFR